MYLVSVINLQQRWKLMVWQTGLHSDRRPPRNLKFGALLKDSMQGFHHPSHTAFWDSYPHQMIFCIKDLLLCRKAKEYRMLQKFL